MDFMNIHLSLNLIYISQIFYLMVVVKTWILFYYELTNTKKSKLYTRFEILQHMTLDLKIGNLEHGYPKTENFTQ